MNDRLNVVGAGLHARNQGVDVPAKPQAECHEPRASPPPARNAQELSRQAYLQQGRIFTPVDPSALNMKSALPPGTYAIDKTESGFHLERVDDFQLPAKLYGNADIRARRIIKTFLDRPSATGVLLSGKKGSGKTMLAKHISQLAMREYGFITLVISQPLCGEDFNTFLQGIQQPAVVVFDEFEKVYSKQRQSKLLTIFDGTYSSKKLFLLTCNDRWQVDSHMHNRPGRLYYALEFDSLDPAFIVEYCEANLVNNENINGVVNVGAFFHEFSFDMLKALVEEMNRFDETATQAMQLLNIKPQADERAKYNIKVIRAGQELMSECIHPSTIRHSPLAMLDDEMTIFLRTLDEPEGVSRLPGYVTEDEHFVLTSKHLAGIDPKKGIFTFRTDQPDTVVVFERDAGLPVSIFNFDTFDIRA